MNPKDGQDGPSRFIWTDPEKLRGRKLAATILLLSRPSSPRSSRILGVSRRDDPNDFGLPGGKLDPHERDAFEFLSAGIRELEEETGIAVGPEDLELCFAAPEREDVADSFVTHTFRVLASSKYYVEVKDPEASEFKTEETGRVAFVDKDSLLAGCFGDYNRRLFTHLGML